MAVNRTVSRRIARPLVMLIAGVFTLVAFAGQEIVHSQATSTNPITPQLRRTGVFANGARNNSQTGQTDSYWSIHRVYNDANIAGDNDGIADANDPGTTCQGTHGRSAILVNEHPTSLGVRAGFLFGGTGFPWNQENANIRFPYGFISTSARWISQNANARHHGDGWYHRVALGSTTSPGNPTVEGCWDPSSNVNGPPGNVGANMDAAHTWVFRSGTVNIFGGNSTYPGIDRERIRINLTGQADNYVGVTVNGNPLQCIGISRGNHGQRDPNRPTNPARSIGQAYLPMCETGFGVNSQAFDTVSPEEESIPRTTSPFLYGANFVEIHVKSAYTHMGLLLEEARLAGAGLACNATATTTSVVGLRYTAGGTSGARLWRLNSNRTGATNLQAITDGSGSVTSTGLSSGASYIFQIRDENNASKVLAEATCSTSSPTYWNYEHRTFSAPPASSTGPAYPSATIGVTVITITNQIQNTGSGNGRDYTHSIQRSIDGGTTWSNISTTNGGSVHASWSEAAIPGNSSNSVRTVNYTIPNSVSAGSVVCFRGAVSPFRGQSTPTSNNTGHPNGLGSQSLPSTVLCVRAVLPNPIVHCSVDTIGSVEVGTTRTLTMRVWYQSAGPPAPSSGLIIARSLSRPGGAVISPPATPALNTPVGGTGNGTSTDPNTIAYTYSVQFTDEAAPYVLTGAARMRFNNGVSNVEVDATACTSEPSVGRMPYIREYGGEVRSGGGGVYAFGNTSGGGSAAQYSILAMLSVNGFSSASLRTIAPGPAKGLTFANRTGTGDATYGGGYGDTSIDIEDRYYDTAIASAGFDLTGPAPIGGRQISGTAIPIGTQRVVKSEGNVIITGDITYNEGAISSVTQIPSYTLIVNGDIYIGNNVGRLDGLYVATGKIYTCANPTDAANRLYKSDALYANCQNQLTINGSLVADHIKFLRVSGSINEATVGEVPNFATGCGAAGNAATVCSHVDGLGGTRAAEIINYTPQMWLAEGPFPEQAGTASQYDSIRTLPPVYNFPEP